VQVAVSEAFNILSIEFTKDRGPFFSFARAKEKNQKKSTADLMQTSSTAEQSSAKSAVRVRT